MAFFRSPSPFSFNVFSPALSVSASLAPSSSPARAAVSSVDAANTTSTAAQLSVLTTERFMLVSSSWRSIRWNRDHGRRNLIVLLCQRHHHQQKREDALGPEVPIVDP